LENKKAKKNADAFVFDHSFIAGDLHWRKGMGIKKRNRFIGGAPVSISRGDGCEMRV
jgi:hypothetical protein